MLFTDLMKNLASVSNSFIYLKQEYYENSHILYAEGIFLCLFIQSPLLPVQKGNIVCINTQFYLSTVSVLEFSKQNLLQICIEFTNRKIEKGSRETFHIQNFNKKQIYTITSYKKVA